MAVIGAFGRAGAFVYGIYAILYYLQTGNLPSISAITVGPFTLFGHQSIPVTIPPTPTPPTPPAPAPPAPTCPNVTQAQVQAYRQNPLVAHGPGGGAVVLSPAYWKNDAQHVGYASVGAALKDNGYFVNRMNNPTPIL